MPRPVEDLGELEKNSRVTLSQFRIGPSPIDDEVLLYGIGTADKDAPQGLDINMAVATGKVKDQSSLAASQVLLTYFGTREHSLNFNHLLNIIKSGADVNYQDTHGQTVLHQTVLFWPVQLADFFYKYGANVNKADNYGRTPLHAASATDNVEMVQWLRKHGAEIDARTSEENQTPIHVASKYNSASVIPILIEGGARLDDLDYKQRTPLQLAAEYGRVKVCRLLMDIGAPAGVYDDSGTACITHMINSMPEVALVALDQFKQADKGARIVKYYLGYLGSSKWKLMQIKTLKGMRELPVEEPLEAIVRNEDTQLIMHPVIQRLLSKKRTQFGLKAFLIELLLNIVFTCIWTALTVTLPIPLQYKTRINFYYPLKENIWRIVLEGIGTLLVMVFIVKSHWDNKVSTSSQNDKMVNRVREIRRDSTFTHPRWPSEASLVDREIKNAYRSGMQASKIDSWFVFDVVTYSGILLLHFTRCVCALSDFEGANPSRYKMAMEIHFKGYAFFVIVLWLRLMKFCRPFTALGPFIAILGYVVKDTLKFLFLFLEFYLPYTCIIWLLFGKKKEDGTFQDPSDVMFYLLRMTMMDDFPFDEMTDEDKLVAQIVCGTYFAIVSVTCLNLYIALLSETFTRVFANATATAFLLQAQALVRVENRMGMDTKEKYGNDIAIKASPETLYEVTAEPEGESNINNVLNELQRRFEEVQRLQGDAKKTTEKLQVEMSDILMKQDTILEDVYYTLKDVTDE